VDSLESSFRIAAPAEGASARLPGKSRILMVVDGRYPSTGGAEMQARLLSRSFAGAGHEVTVVVPRLDRSLPVHDTLDGVKVERIAYPQLKGLGAVILFIRFALLLLWRRKQYDAVHVHTAHYLAAVAGLVRPLTGKTLMVKVTGAWEFQGGVLDPKLRGRPLYRLTNWMLRKTDHMHCISDYTRKMLLEAGYADDQVCMIPNAVDLARFVPTRPPRIPPAVVFVGRLVPVKGLPVLLKAWKKVVAKMPARLVIAGDGPQRDELHQLASDLQLGEHVDFLGNVSDVPSVLAGATVYVQPSYQEGMPNSVLEAMACALPIVATRISGNVDLVEEGDSGLLVPVADEDSLAEALASLLAAPERARAMGLRSREIVERRFSVPSVLQQLLSAYHRPRRAAR
jgi:glycosyltransferase involved in cell wall biosynthesis